MNLVDKIKKETEAAKRQLDASAAMDKIAKKVSGAHAKTVASSAATIVGEHTVGEGESLSAIAQKYFKSGSKEKWMAIYNANKDTIGLNPGNIKAGQVLKIPKLD